MPITRKHAPVNTNTWSEVKSNPVIHFVRNNRPRPIGLESIMSIAPPDTRSGMMPAVLTNARTVLPSPSHHSTPRFVKSSL